MSFDKNGPGFFIILSLLEETLHSRLRRCRISNHGNIVTRVESTALGIAKDVENLQDNNVVFRDLKTINVGFEKETGQVTIFDFGLAAEIRPREQLRSAVGTFRFMAPEAILGDGYGLPYDVYSYGIILWQICALPQMQFAYKCKTRAELLEWVVKRGGRPSLKNLSLPKKNQ